MGKNIQYINCSRCCDTPDASGVVAINCEDFQITSDYNGKIVMRNGALIINEDLSVDASGDVPAYKAGDFNTDYHKPYNIDAAGGNVTANLTGTRSEYVFTRIDASGNTVTIQPLSGTINGVASIPIVGQWTTKTVRFDGTNYTAY